MRATEGAGLKIIYNQDEKQIIDDATMLYSDKLYALESIGEETGYTLQEIEEERRAKIGAIREKAFRRHFRGLGGDPEKIIEDAKYQTEEILKNTWVAFWDYEGANPKQRIEGLTKIEEIIREDLQPYFKALEGRHSAEGETLSDLLTVFIRQKILSLFEAVADTQEIGASIIRAIHAAKELPAEGIRLATDAITRRIFEDRTGGTNERIPLGTDKINGKEYSVGITITNDQIILPEDRLVFHAICTLYLDKYNFITAQDIHNRIEMGTSTYSKMTQKRAEAIAASVERLSGKRFTLDMTAAKEYGGINQIPDETLRKMAAGANMIYTLYWEASTSGREVAGWQILADPTTYLLATAMKQISFLSPKALDIPFRRRPKRKDSLVEFLAIRSFQANGREHKILCSTMYSKIGIEKATDKIKANARDTAEDILEHWKSINLIKGYEFRKGGKGNTIREIILNPRPAIAITANTEQ